MNSRWLRALVLLAVVYFSQFYPYFHGHHFHEENGVKSELIPHPIDIETAHASHHHHHHHDELPADRHPDDHQHSYDKHIDWQILRTQNQRIISFDSDFIGILSVNLPFVNNHFLYKLSEQNVKKTPSDHKSSSDRGPPVFS